MRTKVIELQAFFDDPHLDEIRRERTRQAIAIWRRQHRHYIVTMLLKAGTLALIFFGEVQFLIWLITD